MLKNISITLLLGMIEFNIDVLYDVMKVSLVYKEFSSVMDVEFYLLYFDIHIRIMKIIEFALSSII